jgi:nicotinate (nicotinamide) nucleotide adenylyltransferase
LLRLFAHVKDHYLRVREAHPHETFAHSFQWKGELEIEHTQDPKYTMAWTSLIPDLGPACARALVSFIGSRYPVSPNYQELKKLCPKIVFEGDTDEWVFYGGTFNPWHQGHQACLNLLSPEKTCFVLPDLNPHKEVRTFELVSTVIELSTKIRFNKRQFLVPTFLLERAKNPTINWIERLHQEFPKQKLSLLIGFDSFSKIISWTRSEELLRLLHALYIVSRLETDAVREKAVADVKAIAPYLEITLLGRHGFEELSSTEVRRRL